MASTEEVDCNITEDDIIARQKFERKKLQAEIQGLKHSIPKGDKKKKKEVTAKVALLEAELDAKFEKELKEFRENKGLTNLCNETEGLSTNDVDYNELEAESENIQTKKKSKAQKRREKTSQKEREREERIRDQEKENLLGNRHLEQQNIKKLLKSRNLKLNEMPSDGNCMYAAIVDQLMLHGIETQMQALRLQTSDFMLKNPDEFFPFLTKIDTGDPYTFEEFEKYCSDIASTPAWGGQLELKALSNILKHPIEVFQAEGPCIIIGEEHSSSPKLNISYHRHMYNLGEHYNSVVPRDPGDEEEDS